MLNLRTRPSCIQPNSHLYRPHFRVVENNWPFPLRGIEQGMFAYLHILVFGDNFHGSTTPPRTYGTFTNLPVEFDCVILKTSFYTHRALPHAWQVMLDWLYSNYNSCQMACIRECLSYFGAYVGPKKIYLRAQYYLRASGRCSDFNGVHEIDNTHTEPPDKGDFVQCHSRCSSVKVPWLL